MIDVIAAAKAPEIDYQGLAPLIATAGGAIVVLMAGLFRGPLRPARAGAAAGRRGAGRRDRLHDRRTGSPATSSRSSRARCRSTRSRCSCRCSSTSPGLVAIVLSLRSDRVQEAGARRVLRAAARLDRRHGRCSRARRTWSRCSSASSCCRSRSTCCAPRRCATASSLESGLKYLVIGSVGSATLLYGLAFVYGATGITDLSKIGAAIGDTVSAGDPLLLTGVALVAVGLAFKASVAPFHQWTPDVYQGAPTPITAFMAVATKVAAFAIVLRLFGGTLIDLQDDWAPALAVAGDRDDPDRQRRRASTSAR